MEVWINGESRARAGGADFDLLTLGVIRAPVSSSPVVVLTARKKGTEETIQWINAPVRSGDKVQGMLHPEGAGTPAPPAEELVQSGQAEILPASSTCAFIVQVGAHIARVSSDSSATLMVTATWHHLYEHCKLEVTRLPKHEADPNRCWFELPVDLDQPITVEIR